MEKKIETAELAQSIITTSLQEEEKKTAVDIPFETEEERIQKKIEQEKADKKRAQTLRQVKYVMRDLEMDGDLYQMSDESILEMHKSYALSEELFDQLNEECCENIHKKAYVDSVKRYISGVGDRAYEAEIRTTCAAMLYTKNAAELSKAIREGGERTARLIPLLNQFQAMCDRYSNSLDDYLDADIDAVFALPNQLESHWEICENTILGHKRWMEGVEAAGVCYLMMAGNMKAMADALKEEQGVQFVEEGLSSLDEFKECTGESAIEAAKPFYEQACKTYRTLSEDEVIARGLEAPVAEYCKLKKDIVEVKRELDTTEDVGLLRVQLKRLQQARSVTTNPETRRDMDEEIASRAKHIDLVLDIFQYNQHRASMLDYSTESHRIAMDGVKSFYRAYRESASCRLLRRVRDKYNEVHSEEIAEKSRSESLSRSYMISSYSESYSISESISVSESMKSRSVSESISASISESESQSEYDSRSREESVSESISASVSISESTSQSISTSESLSESTSLSVSVSESESLSESISQSEKDEELKIVEARARVNDLTVLAEELEARLAVLAERESCLEGKYREEGYNSCMTFMQGQLHTYIPKDATGRLDDYVVRNERVEGVGKGQVFWEKLTFGIKTGKLNERIKKHVKRFLDSGSKDITERDVCATATEVVRAGGLFGESFIKECSKEGVVSDNKFKSGLIAENDAKRLNLMAEIEQSDDLTRMREFADRAKELIGEGNEDELKLSEEYFARFGYASKTILMYRLIRGIKVSEIQGLNKKFRDKFEDRIRATADNLRSLNDAVVNSPDYQYALVRRKKFDIRASLSNELHRFNELNTGMSYATPDLTVADNPEATLEELRLGIASADRIMEQALAARSIQEQERVRAFRTESEQASDTAYEFRALEAIERSRREAAARMAAQLAEDKAKLFDTGVAKNGYKHEEWHIPEYADRVRAYIGEEIEGATYEVYSSSLCDVNDKITANLKLIDKYLNQKGEGTLTEKLLANEKLRKIAVNDVAANLDERLFKENKEDSFFTHIRMKWKTIRLNNFDDAVSKAKKIVSSVPGMEGMEEGVLMGEGVIEILLEGDKTKIRNVLEQYKAAYDINIGIIRENCEKLPESIREESARNIAERIQIQLLNASPDSIKLIAQREVEYLSLFNPEVFETDRKVRAAAASVGASERAVCMLKTLDRSLLKKWDEKKAKEKLAEYNRMISDEFEYIANVVKDSLEEIKQETWALQGKALTDGISQEDESRLETMHKATLYYSRSDEHRLEVKKKVIAELEMKIATKWMTKSGVKKAARELIVQYASHEQKKLDFEEIRSKKTTGEEGVYEDLIVKELFQNEHFGRYLSTDVDYYMELIREQMVKDKLDGMKTTADMPKVKPVRMYEYLEILKDRLALAEPLFDGHFELSHNLQVAKQLLREMLSGEERTYEEWLEHGEKLNTDSVEKRAILEDRDTIMTSGENWTSHRAYIDLFNQKINTGRGIQFRAVNRMYRMRDLSQRVLEVCDGNEGYMPVSFYDYVTANTRSIADITDTAKMEELRKGWIKSLDEWVKVRPKERKDIADELKEITIIGKYKNSVYYGLEKAMNIVLQGVTGSINDDERKQFEDRLEQVGFVYSSRVSVFDAECVREEIDGQEKENFRRNIEGLFTDRQEDYEKKLKEVKKANPGFTNLEVRTKVLADLDSEYKAKLRSAIKAVKASRIDDRDGEYELEKKRRLQALIARKDRRFSQIYSMDEGIYIPLLHLIAKGGVMYESILADKEEEFEKRLKEFTENTHEAMIMLSTDKGAYGAFIDQYLLRFGQQILEGELKDKATAQKAFEDYYREIITHKFVSDKGKTATIDGLVKKAREGKKDEEATREGNLVIQVMLYEGALEIADSGKMDVYRRRLEANTKVFNEVMELTYNTEAFAKYIQAVSGQKVKALKKRLEDRSQALKETFKTDMMMEEREYLILTDNPAVYKSELSRRITSMLSLSNQVRIQTDTANKKRLDAHEVMQTVIVSEKVEGRKLLREEKADLDKYNEYAKKRYSPVMVAYGMHKKKDKVKAVESLKKRLKDVKTDYVTKGLLYDALVAGLARNSVITADRIPVCIENIRKLRERSKLDIGTSTGRTALIRLILSENNIAEELSEAQIAARLEEAESHVSVGKLLTDITLIRETLPKDGTLNSFYSDVITKASYKAFEKDTSKAMKELTELFVTMRNRVLLSECIDKYISDNMPNLVQGNKYRLKAGIFDLYAKEYAKAKVVLDKKAIKKSFEKRLESVKSGEITMTYIMDDRGSYVSVDSEKGIAESEVFSAQVTRDDFEKELSKHAKNPLVKEYMELSVEEKILFGHIAGCDKIVESSNASLSLDAVYRIHAFTNSETNIEGILDDYVEGKEIMSVPDYANVRRSLYVDGKLDEEAFKKVLVVIQARKASKVEKNVDLALLGTSAEETRKVMGKDPAPHVVNKQDFLDKLAEFAENDTAADDAGLLVDEMCGLKDYEFHMLMVVLSDRTALDERLDKKGVVGKKRRELLEKNLDTAVNSVLASMAPGEALLNRVLSTLMSYRIREDVIIQGEIRKSDLYGTDRKTVIDYDLIRKALRMIQGIS